MATKNWFKEALAVGGLTRKEMKEALCVRAEATAISRENYPGQLRIDELLAVYQRLDSAGRAKVREALSEIFN